MVDSQIIPAKPGATDTLNEMARSLGAVRVAEDLGDVPLSKVARFWGYTVSKLRGF